MKIHGVEGMSAETIRDEISRGGRLVIYTYCISVFVLTFKRPTDIRLVKVGHSPVAAGLPFTLVSLLFGWWGFPWGPIYTIQTIYRNLSGGIDVTHDVLRQLVPAAQAAAAVAPAPALTAAAAPARGFNARVALFMAFAAVALVAGGIGIYCYQQSQNLTVALVSGLDQPYTVMLNGKAHRLAPHGAQVVSLPEGAFTLQDAAGGHIVGNDRTFQFSTPLFSHLGAEHMAVINPDRTAVLFAEEVPYYSDGTTPPDHEEPVYTVLANQPGYFIAKPDYVLEPAAKRISMPSGTTRLVKTRLEQVTDTAFTGVLHVLDKKAGYAAVREHLMLLAPHHSEEAFLSAALVTLKAEDLRPFFLTRLAERPVVVEWHRFYQQAMEYSEPSRDLAGEYRGYLQKEPADGALLYLLGRMTADNDEAQRLWQQALEARPPCPQALAALGFDALCEARFTDALEKLTAAEKAGVAGNSRRQYRRQIFLALGQYEPLLAELRADRKANPLDIELAGEEIRAGLAAGGNAEAAKKLKAGFIASLKADGDSSESLAEADAYLQSIIDYQTGRLADYVEHLSHLDGPYYQFHAALTRGELQPAAAIILGLPKPRGPDVLLLYLLAKRSGDEAQAEKHFAQAIEVMRKSSPEFRKTAELLAAPQPDVDKICRVRIDAGDKCVLLTALGVRDPAHRATYHALAAKLDFNPDFPHQFLHGFLAPAGKL